MKNKNIFMIGLFAAIAIVASTTMVGSKEKENMLFRVTIGKSTSNTWKMLNKDEQQMFKQLAKDKNITLKDFRDALNTMLRSTKQRAEARKKQEILGQMNNQILSTLDIDEQQMLKQLAKDKNITVDQFREMLNIVAKGAQEKKLLAKRKMLEEAKKEGKLNNNAIEILSPLVEDSSISTESFKKQLDDLVPIYW